MEYILTFSKLKCGMISTVYVYFYSRFFFTWGYKRWTKAIKKLINKTLLKQPLNLKKNLIYFKLSSLTISLLFSSLMTPNFKVLFLKNKKSFKASFYIRPCWPKITYNNSKHRPPVFLKLKSFFLSKPSLCVIPILETCMDNLFYTKNRKIK